MLHFLSFFLITLFRPSLSHFEIASQSFQFSVKIFSQSVLAGGGAKNFSLGPNPFLAALLLLSPPPPPPPPPPPLTLLLLWHTMKFYCNYIYIPIPNIASSSSLWHEQTDNTLSYTLLKAAGLSTEEQISETNS
jgi:hypothetical protein